MVIEINKFFNNINNIEDNTIYTSKFIKFISYEIISDYHIVGIEY
ncbi:40310_t:CDS:1, partial [Gigaspora margarita]